MSDFLYTNVSVVAASATVGISNSGFFHGLIINDIGTSPVISIYDSLTPTITTTIIGKLKPTITGPYFFDVNFKQGLQFVVTGSPNFTILYHNYKSVILPTE